MNIPLAVPAPTESWRNGAGAALLRHCDGHTRSSQPMADGALGRLVTRCRQTLHRVRIEQCLLLLVGEGWKELVSTGDRRRLSRGALFVMTAGTQVDVSNEPARGGEYRALMWTFGPQLLNRFHTLHPGRGHRPLTGCGVAPEPTPALLSALLHCLEGSGQPLPAAVAEHRPLEILLALADQGLVFPPLNPHDWATRLRRLMANAPAAPWSAARLAAELSVSEATLRRHLARQGTSVRKLMQEVRLAHGLDLLLTGERSVTEVSLACGYASPSRFAVRFRERYGMAPASLKD